MPNQRYERREPTHEWSQVRPLLKDPTQIQYEILRPIVLFGVSPKERSVETGVSKTALYFKANLFDQAGMASLVPPTLSPEIPKQDKRALPPPMRQAIVDAYAEYPGLSLHEIARMCYVTGQEPSQAMLETLKHANLFVVSLATTTFYMQGTKHELPQAVATTTWTSRGVIRYAGQAHHFSRAPSGEQRASRHPQSASITHSTHWS